MIDSHQPLTGLNDSQVAESRRLHGTNILTPPPKPSLWIKFFDCFKDPLIRILLVALLLSIGISIYEYAMPQNGAGVFLEPLGILVAILLATVIGFALEVNANNKFEILNQVNDDIAVTVIRNGSVMQIARKDIVVGDIVILETGDEVPADGRLINSVGLSINESTLTGEPIAHKSHIVGTEKSETTYPINMALRGTSVVEGRGEMVVTAVGDLTEYGKVYTAAQIDNGVKTPLTVQFDRLGRFISISSYIVGALIVIGRMLVFQWDGASTIEIIDYSLATIMLAITLIVVSVPEGLPMSVTLSLALSMRRMLISNNLVRKMHACETMGATTVICTDKTGTLTQNQMQIYATNFSILPENQSLGNDEASTLIKEGIAVNSTAFLDTHEDSSTPKVLGNPTEGALLLWLNANNVDYLSIRENAQIIKQLPFSTQRKYMATVVESPLLKRKVLYVKGAPEIVMNLCPTIANNVAREEINAQLSEYQQKAMRTLGFAYAYVDNADEAFSDGELNAKDLTFIGVTAISDPVRAEVPDAIQTSINAGIGIKIVTGDTPGTAKEIGRQVGLWTDNDNDSNHISGPDFAALSDEEASKRVKALKIMSRARPTDKSRLVKLLQDAGEVVAVTGDGTNDAPALNAAQVGLSMGDGTAVAKEASDITIMDNSFASITKAVMWGRSLYQNIQRFILFQLTVNLVACVIVTIGAFTGTQSPLNVTQMLWVNLIMDTFAALALASLPPSEEVMNRRPRRPSDFIINKKISRDIIGVGILFVVFLYGMLQYLRVYHIDTLLDFNLIDFFKSFFNFSGNDLTTYDLTIFFTIFVFLQVWNIFNARAHGSGHTPFDDWVHSKVFFGTIAVILVGQILIVNVGGEMFNVEPLKLIDWVLIIAGTSPIMLVPMICNLIRRHRK
jgi:Ca2+-transporting ATPase